MKTTPVFFQAWDTSKFKHVSGSFSTILYNNNTVNIGGGFDSQTGIFTVPRTGKYLFTFIAHGRSGGSKGPYIFICFRRGETNFACSLDSSASDTFPLHLQATHILNAGDKVTSVAYILSGHLGHNGGSPENIFSGLLLEEDISSTLANL